MEIIIGIAVVAALGYFLFLAPYNSLVKLRNSVQESWRQVDVELNRRYELIPNLVETVKGYATHEHNTLEDIVNLRNEARAAATGGGALPSASRAEIEGALSGAVTQFLAVTEAYPELKANENFRELQRQLVDTEDRIANGRRYYNAVVGNYNTKIDSFPSNLAANAFSFKKAGYFEASDPALRTAPEVKFDQIAYRPEVQDSRPALGDGSSLGSPVEVERAPEVEFDILPEDRDNPGDGR